MFNTPFSKRSLFTSIIISFIILFTLLLQAILQKHTRIVFCDVGQGDSIYIRTFNNVDILIDAGPSKSVLNCLGKHMPFFDRTIELAFISHPQKDHYGGYIDILDRYSIAKMILSPVDNQNQSFGELENKLFELHVPVDILLQGDKITISNNSVITFIWPTKDYIANDSLSRTDSTTDVLGLSTTRKDLNSFSQIFTYSEGNFDILFTGDISPKVLDSLANDSEHLQSAIEILKIPHHGSKNGLTSSFFDVINPQLSVISVGKNNSFGHPSKETLSLLENHTYLTTAHEGDIVIEVEDGSWTIK